MKTSNDTMASQIDHAANEAVFWHQLPTHRAVRFITKQVKGATTEQAEKAVKNVVVSYKSKATA